MDGDGIKLAILSFLLTSIGARGFPLFGIGLAPPPLLPSHQSTSKIPLLPLKTIWSNWVPLSARFYPFQPPKHRLGISNFPFEFHQKMASKMNSSSHSAGRPSTVQKTAQLLVHHHPPPQNSFVFGSSTPRELSHITHPKVTKRERLIDTKLKPKRNAGDRDIVYYMRQARSRDSRDPERKGISRNYAFGSSTPRSLSHMSNLTKAQRVYDAKMERKLDHWTDERNAAQNAGANRSLSTRDSRREEDALSEPDLVQDRQKDFDLGKPGMGKTNNEWTKSQMAEQNGGEDEGENGERRGELEAEAVLNQRAVSREIDEDDGKVKLNIRVPNLEAERGNMVQNEGEEEDRGEGGIGIRKIAGGGHISPVSDF